MRKTLMQALVASVGGLGALVSFFFMVLGPLITTPPPSGIVLLAALGYPLLMAVSAVVGVFSFRYGLLAAIAATVCAVVVILSYASDESFGELIGFWAIVAAPAIIQGAVCGIAIIVVDRRPPGP
ncbi:MAG: hypothetical protein ACTHQE_02450 [Thermomicrobiales bacterium]